MSTKSDIKDIIEGAGVALEVFGIMQAMVTGESKLLPYGTYNSRFAEKPEQSQEVKERGERIRRNWGSRFV